MNEQTAILTPDQSDRDRAIIEAGRLIDALHDGNGDLVKDVWYQLNKFTRAAMAEIRTAEARANGLQYSTPDQFGVALPFAKPFTLSHTILYESRVAFIEGPLRHVPFTSWRIENLVLQCRHWQEPAKSECKSQEKPTPSVALR